MRTPLPVLVIAALLGGCQTTSTNVGQGPPPPLSNQVANFFNEYKGIPGANKSFAVSINGQAAGASHCGSKYGAAASSLDEGRCNTEFMALKECRSKSLGSPCFIYAWGNNVVWGGNQTPVQSAVTSPASPQSSATTSNGSTRKFVAIWEGVPGPVSGDITFATHDSTAVVSLSGSHDLSCEGLATFGKDGRGNWVIKCKDDTILSGTLRELGPNRTVLGVGQDNKGRKITFSVSSL